MKQAHITEHHSRQWFEQLFEGFAADYHLSDASDFLTLQAQVTQSIECLSFRSACDLFEVQGCRSYKALGAAVARRFVSDRCTGSVCDSLALPECSSS